MSSTLKAWPRDPMEAASINCGICTCGSIRIDLIAQDGNTFAAAHIDVATCLDFIDSLTIIAKKKAELIVEGMTKQ